jgi:hypothetical protein
MPESTTAPATSAEASIFNEKKFRETMIPFTDKNSKQYKAYEQLIPVLASRKPSDVPRIVVVTDVEQDYDDLLAIIFLSEMHHLGAVNLAGLITNHGRPLERAKFLRSVMHLLGVGNIEVAQGTFGISPFTVFNPGYYELKNTTFERQEWNDKPFRTGRELLEHLTKQVVDGKEEPLTVLLISSLQDISEYLQAHRKDPALLKRVFKKFVSQGGYTVDTKPDENGVYNIKPLLNMANNSSNEPAAWHYTKCLAQFGLPSDTWSREAAKAAPLKGTVFTEGAQYGPIGTHLNWLYKRQEFKFYWDPFNAPYMPRLNNYWYLTTRCVMDPDSPAFAAYMKSPPPFHEILPQSKALAYDGCAAMGACGDDVMRALGVMGDHIPVPEYNKKAHRHRIFGAAKDDIGGVDGARLSEVLDIFLFGALIRNKDLAEKLIPSSSVEHETEAYDVDLTVFEHQVPFLKESNKLAGEKDDEESQKALEKLQSEHLLIGGKQYPKVPVKPDGIPYELLYQKAKSLAEE